MPTLGVQYLPCLTLKMPQWMKTLGSVLVKTKGCCVQWQPPVYIKHWVLTSWQLSCENEEEVAVERT